MSKKVDDLIKLKNKQGGKLYKGDLKGLTDKELHEFVDKVVKGGTAIKAAAYSSLIDKT